MSQLTTGVRASGIADNLGAMRGTWVGVALVLGLSAGCDCGGPEDVPPIDDCAEDADCTSANPWCVDNSCVQCRDQADCPVAGQTCDDGNQCRGAGVDAGGGDAGPGRDAGGTACVGAPPQCCADTMPVDAFCMGTSWICPPGSGPGPCTGMCVPLTSMCCRQADGGGGSVPAECLPDATNETCPVDSVPRASCCPGSNPGCCFGPERAGDAVCDPSGWRCTGEAALCMGDA